MYTVHYLKTINYYSREKNKKYMLNSYIVIVYYIVCILSIIFF